MKPFLLRNHHEEMFSMLTDEQLGKVIRNLFSAARNEYDKKDLDDIVRVATINTIFDINMLHNQRKTIDALTCRNWAELRRSVFLRDGCTCQYCGKTGTDMTCDHVEPKQHGGEDTIENLVTSCRSCNSKKGARPYLWSYL